VAGHASRRLCPLVVPARRGPGAVPVSSVPVLALTTWRASRGCGGRRRGPFVTRVPPAALVVVAGLTAGSAVAAAAAPACMALKATLLVAVATTVPLLALPIVRVTVVHSVAPHSSACVAATCFARIELRGVLPAASLAVAVTAVPLLAFLLAVSSCPLPLAGRVGVPALLVAVVGPAIASERARHVAGGGVLPVGGCIALFSPLAGR
jgi:hypothetical protein